MALFDHIVRPWTSSLAFLNASKDKEGMILPDVAEVTVLAEGAMGVLFAYATTTHAFVLKANKATPCNASSSKPTSALRRQLTNVCPYEVDITMFLWDVLAVSGASVHVVCPYAVVSTIIPRSLQCSVGTIQALAMEKLTGLQTRTGSVIYNLQDLVVEGAKNNIDDFDAVFRTVLFQVLYTITTWTYLTDGSFRHNDLYARNVGLSRFTAAPDAPPVNAEYVVHTTPRGDKTAYVESMFCVRTNVRAVVLDFGWSAVLPTLGPKRDARFYRQCRAKGKLVRQVCTRSIADESGMSQSVFSHHYDCTLLMVSVYMLIVRQMTSSRLLPQVLQEFKTLYESTYKHLHDSDMMHSGALIGRLTNKAQDVLRKGVRLQCALRADKQISGKSNGFAVTVPNARDLLMFPFFSGFRTRCKSCTGTDVLRFGINIGSASTVTPVLVQTPTRQHVSGSPIAPSLNVFDSEFSTGCWKQSMGNYSTLLEKIKSIRARFRDATVRAMTDAEADAWMGIVTPTTPAGAAATSVTTSSTTSSKCSLKRARNDNTSDAGLQKPRFDSRTPSSAVVKSAMVFAPCTPILVEEHWSYCLYAPKTPFEEYGCSVEYYAPMTPL